MKTITLSDLQRDYLIDLLEKKVCEDCDNLDESRAYILYRHLKYGNN